ncbi:siderophore-interacting protein [Cypionkella sp.]|uniref:siderophore-interacting protein n=1 Tax=Cypionkella sp. TaxID=2811411 RepID=UPI002627DA92|nr:siderophore-interacting protein [Cypionkella sp.]MDB5665526.1 hypothetical protein [Cypionkella sp.]
MTIPRDQRGSTAGERWASRDGVRRLTGTDLSRFPQGGLHFRLLLPRLGHAPLWPRIAADGRTEWPEGPDAMNRPVYTVRDIDPAGAWLDLDVYLHEGGRVTEWTQNAMQGTWVGLMDSSGREAPEAAWVPCWR